MLTKLGNENATPAQDIQILLCRITACCNGFYWKQKGENHRAVSLLSCAVCAVLVKDMECVLNQRPISTLSILQ